jgi:hypothetical protein
LVTARQQLRKKALLGNGWPQQYQGRVFYGVRSQAINPRAMKSVKGDRHREWSRERKLEIENEAHTVGGCRSEIISCNWL